MLSQEPGVGSAPAGLAGHEPEQAPVMAAWYASVQKSEESSTFHFVKIHVLDIPFCRERFFGIFGGTFWEH